MASSVVTSIEGLRQLRGEWEVLASRAGSPMLDHDWVLSCAETLHAERDLRIVLIRERGELAGIAPLARERGGPGRHLVLLGAARLYEPGGWLFASSAALGELAAAVVQLRTPVLLHRIPRESGVASALRQLPRFRCMTVVRPSAMCLAVDTRGTWSVHLSRLSGRTRRAFSNGLIGAERALGPVKFEERRPTTAEVEPTLKMFADLERSGWKGRRGSAVSQREDLSAFLRNYCRSAAERGRLRVTTLSFGGQIAAAEIALDAYQRRWGLKIAYREDLAAHSPGLHLVHASIRAAFEHGLAAYEFLGSAEEWQHRWRPEPREHELVLIYPWSLSGLTGALGDLGVRLRRRAVRVGS